MDDRGWPEGGVGTWIERWARWGPDRPALVTGERSVSYGELADRVRRLSGALRDLGVERGDRVGWIGPNHPAFIEALFAAARLGAALAPVNHRLPVEQRAAILADTEPVVLIEHAMDETTPAAWVRARIAVDPGRVGEGARPFEGLLDGSSDGPDAVRVGSDELCLLPHTSGTTGRPRGVMLTHRNVTANAVDFLVSAGYRRDDVTIAIAPLFRSGGSGVNVLPMLFAGGAVIVPDDPRPDRLVELMERHRVTVGFANPDVLDGLTRADEWPTADLGSVRFILTGGAPVPERLIRTFIDRGIPLLQGYGLSEAAPLVLLLDPSQALTKVGSAGRPPLLVDVRVVDDDGRDVEPGRTGELLARGPNVMAGYWRRPDATSRVLDPEGWLHTGDAARIDEDGDVWIVDRVDARFMSGGQVTYPADIEAILSRHPAVSEVAVIGPGDAPADGEEARGPIAIVVPVSGTALRAPELLAFGRDHLAGHQAPVAIVVTDELPRNSVGKLIRSALPRIVASSPGRRM